MHPVASRQPSKRKVKKSPGKPSPMQTITLLLLTIFLIFLSPVCAQQPAPPPPPPDVVPSPGVGTPAATPPATELETAHRRKPLPGFLILGTVFDEKALSFPGVQIRIRRSNEKKYRWETYTNSRGEFAVRVPEGPVYEVAVRAKKYRDQSQKVNSVNGDTQQRLSIRLEAESGQKIGANKP